MKSRGLRDGEMILRVGNGARVVAEAVGTYPLQSSSNFRLVLKDYYCVLVTSQNLIFVSVLA